jgi:plastocyanin
MKTRMFLTALALSAGFSTVAMAQVGGTVKLDGKAPEMPKIDLGTVPLCAGVHKDGLKQETVVTGADNGLANVVVSVKKEEGMELPAPAGAAAPAALDQKGCQYSPHVVAVMAGQQLLVKNSDALLHNVHTLPEKNQGENKAMPSVDANGAKLKSPTEPEYFRVKCDVHPWMGAWVAVLDNPYFAVTDKDGKFTLPKGLPNGEYTLHVWHEKLGEQDTKITVTDGKGDANITVKGS